MKSAWSTTASTAWRIFTLSNGGSRWLNRTMIVLPSGSAGATVMSGLAASTGQTSSRRVLPPIGFAAVERRHLGHRIGDVEPFDPVDLDHLAARGPARRLVARHVIGVLDVDHLVAGLELLLDEFERARADHLGDLLEGVGLGEPLRHDEQRQARHLGEAVDQQRKRLLQLDREALVVVRPCISSTTVASVWPSASRAIQRLIEATQSAPRTGWPS